MLAPLLPRNINTNNIINVTAAPYNAIGNGVITNTTAIQNAINAAAAGGTTNGLSGGIVEIPAGTFLCGPVTLKNKVDLQVDAGGLLQMLSYGSWPGTTTFISGSSIQDVAITGPGTIDGQGAAWWTAYGSSGISRPNFIQFSSSSRILIENVTLQNPPTFHIMIKNNNANITVQGITINTPGTSPNTDGFDISSTNVLIQNCYISDGDDNVEIGGSALAAEITVTNCTFGTGHGVSIGSITSGAVSNVVVANCTFSGTDNGIRMKSDNDRGGIVQNLTYYNIGMTNIKYAPILIYSYYGSYGNPTTAGITPAIAAAMPVGSVTATPPVWRNIVISNVTATAGQPGMIWARTELPATNLTLTKLNITASGSFDLYNVSELKLADAQINQPAGTPTFALFDAQAAFTNSVPASKQISLGGVTTNGYGNTLYFQNCLASLSDTNLLDNGPLTLGDSLFTISNNLTLFPSTVLNFTLDTSTNRVAVMGNLALGGTINVTAGNGFAAGTNTLLTYTGTLSGGLPMLGTTPAGYNYSLNTSTAGKINLIVTSPAPPAPANLTATGTNLQIYLNWNAVAGASSYNLKRGITTGGPYPAAFNGLTATSYSDGAVTNGVNYFYVATAVVSGTESTNSLEANAAPLPSNQPTNIVAQINGGTLQLSWPQDHLGWRLQVQTNNLATGIGTNWFTVPNSTNVISTGIGLDPANDSVFLRLVYP